MALVNVFFSQNDPRIFLSHSYSRMAGTMKLFFPLFSASSAVFEPTNLGLQVKFYYCTTPASQGYITYTIVSFSKVLG
jgi:hypothetical protein